MKYIFLILLSSCSFIDRLEKDDYVKETKEKMPWFYVQYDDNNTVNLKELIEDFFIYQPTQSAITCKEEYRKLIETYKKVALSERLQQNLIILCQEMIWDGKYGNQKKSLKSKQTSVK